MTHDLGPSHVLIFLATAEHTLRPFSRVAKLCWVLDLDRNTLGDALKHETLDAPTLHVKRRSPRRECAGTT